MPRSAVRRAVARVTKAPQAVGWLAEPGRIEIPLVQMTGTHMPWLEVALALFLLLMLASGEVRGMLAPAAALALAVVAFGWLYETRQFRGRPALIRLDWESQQAELMTLDGRTTTRDLRAPSLAYPIRLPLATRTIFATGWEDANGQWLVVRHRNRSEATNFLRDLAGAGWATSREELPLV